MQTLTIEFPRSLFACRPFESVEEQVILHAKDLIQSHATLMKLEDSTGPRWEQGNSSPDAVKLVASYDDGLSDSMRSPEQLEENLIKTMDVIWAAHQMSLRFPGGPEFVIKQA
jgi:hypothetical protein